MDHEFGTTFLEASQVGWDWFSLQLDDGSDLMLFQLRRADGASDPHSAGTWVDAAGVATPLGAGEFTLVPGRRWSSPSSDAVYPVQWRVEVPGRAAHLDISAVVDAQELNTPASTGVTYWEGAVTVSGQVGGRAVSGRGYLEMTGYAGPPMSELFR
jgi:predicted secreted hydrolase